MCYLSVFRHALLPRFIIHVHCNQCNVKLFRHNIRIAAVKNAGYFYSMVKVYFHPCNIAEIISLLFSTLLVNV